MPSFILTAQDDGEDTTITPTETEHTTVFISVAAVLFGVEGGLILLLDALTLPRQIHMLRQNLHHIFSCRS